MKTKIISSRTKISGIISAVLLAASAVLVFMDFVCFTNGEAYVSTFEAGIACGILSFIFALVGIIKPKNSEMGKMLCWAGIICPAIFGLFVLFITIIFKNTIAYTDEYLYDKNRNKINFDVGEGYFKYDRNKIGDVHRTFSGAGGRFYYFFDFHGPKSQGEHPNLPYCYLLYSHDDPDFVMIDLESFCKFNSITFETHEESRTTEISIYGSRIVLPWEKYQAHDNRGTTYDLKYPIVYYGLWTFVEVDFLYQTGMLKLHDEEACVDFINHLRKANDLIRQKGEGGEGIYTYRENKIAGACTYFYNNELLADSKVKIGMSREEVISVLGEPCDPKDMEIMAYPYFWMKCNEDQCIRMIEVDWEGVYYALQKKES